MGRKNIAALICAHFGQTTKTSSALKSSVDPRNTSPTFLPSLSHESVTYLHLLVDLPLHGVRRFSAAFVFWRSPFLHLWHSPASLDGSESDHRLRVGLWRLRDQWRGWEWKLSLPLTAAVIPSVPIPHLVASHHPCPAERACALQAGDSADEQSALFSPVPPSSVRLQAVSATSG